MMVDDKRAVFWDKHFCRMLPATTGVELAVDGLEEKRHRTISEQKVHTLPHHILQGTYMEKLTEHERAKLA